MASEGVTRGRYGRGRRRRKMPGECRIWGGPMKRTKSRLHAYEIQPSSSNVSSVPLLPLQSLRDPVRVSVNLEDLDRLVRGARGQSAAIVVEYGIMLNEHSQQRSPREFLAFFGPVVSTSLCATLTIISSCPESEIT